MKRTAITISTLVLISALNLYAQATGGGASGGTSGQVGGSSGQSGTLPRVNDPNQLPPPVPTQPTTAPGQPNTFGTTPNQFSGTNQVAGTNQFANTNSFNTITNSFGVVTNQYLGGTNVTPTGGTNSYLYSTNRFPNP